jgi:ABC-type glycerol-3-phosphate transport system permease component
MKLKKFKFTNYVSSGLQYILTIIILLFILFPFFWILSTSLKSPQDVMATPPTLIPKRISFINFQNAMEHKNLLMFVKNSLIVTISTIVLTIVLAVPAAYAINFFRFKFNKSFSSILIAIQILPVVVSIVPLFMMFRFLGIANTRFSLILAYSASAWGLPIAIILLNGFFIEIPKELFEAARVDGCSAIKVLMKIVIPLGMPGIVSTCIYVFISVWQELMLILRLTTNSDLRTLPLGLGSFFSEHGADWGGLMATAVVIAVPSIVLFLIVQNYFIDNLAGAVKG